MTKRHENDQGTTAKTGQNAQSALESDDMAVRDTTGKGTPNAATQQVTTGTNRGRFQVAGEGATGPHRGSTSTTPARSPARISAGRIAAST